MTNRLPFRITIWQSLVRRLMLLRTFMGSFPFGDAHPLQWAGVVRVRSLPEGDPSLGHVVRADFHLHLVSRQDADEELPHLAAYVGHDLLAILQFHFEVGIGQGLGDFSFKRYFFLLGHACSASP